MKNEGKWNFWKLFSKDLFAKWNINSREREREKYRQLWFLIFSRYSDIICIQRGIHFQTKNNESDLERKENIATFIPSTWCMCMFAQSVFNRRKTPQCTTKAKVLWEKKKKKVKCRTLKIKTIFSPLIFTQSSRINDKELRSVVSFVWKKKKKNRPKIYIFLSYNYCTGKNDDNLSFDSNEIKFSSLFSGESFSSLHDEKTIVQLEFEHGELRRATDHRGGKHVGGRGGGMAEERIASTMHGSRFSILEPLSIVTVERSKEAFSTDAAVYFRDNRIAGTKIMHLNPLPFPNNVFLICFRISWLIIVACNFQVIFERKKNLLIILLFHFIFLIIIVKIIRTIIKR